MYYGGEGHKNKWRDWRICHLYVNQDAIILKATVVENKIKV